MPSVRYLLKGVTLDSRTRDYIDKRMQKINKFADNALLYEVEVDMDKKGKFRVEVMVKTPYELYRSEEISQSIEGSADMAVEDIINQITKDKDRIKELRERGARSIKKKIVLDENARF